MNITTTNTISANVQATVNTLQYLTESTEGFFGVRPTFPASDMISTLDNMSFSTSCLRTHVFGIASGDIENFNNPSEAMRVYALLPELIDSCIDCAMSFEGTLHEVYGKHGTAFKLTQQNYVVKCMAGTDRERDTPIIEFCEAKLHDITNRLEEAYYAAVHYRAEYEQRGMITPELLTGINDPDLTKESVTLIES